MRWRIAYVRAKSAIVKLHRRWLRDKLWRQFLRRTKRMVNKVPIVISHWLKWRVKKYKCEHRRMYGSR